MTSIETDERPAGSVPGAPTGAPRVPAGLADGCPAPPPPAPADGEPRHTISEVAARTGLTAHTLRWYERIGLMPHIDRSHTGQRRFSDRDLRWLDLVGKLRLTGMPVADMVRYAELVRAGDQTVGERLELLGRTRDEVARKIAELQDTLTVLDYKLDHYKDVCQASDRNLTT